MRHFYVVFYDDPYKTSVSEIWRFIVHSMQKYFNAPEKTLRARCRIDVNTSLGQTRGATLVIKGSHTGRRVRCFSDSPTELMAKPEGIFDLYPDAMKEIRLLLRPKQIGRKEHILHVVGRLGKQMTSMMAHRC